MNKIELNPMEQDMLEQRYLADIHECNHRLKKWNWAYNNWDEFIAADKRYADVYHDRENFKIRVIDNIRADRRRLVKKLNEQIRQGFVFE